MENTDPAPPASSPRILCPCNHHGPVCHYPNCSDGEKQKRFMDYCEKYHPDWFPPKEESQVAQEATSMITITIGAISNRIPPTAYRAGKITVTDKTIGGTLEISPQRVNFAAYYYLTLNYAGVEYSWPNVKPTQNGDRAIFVLPRLSLGPKP